MSPYHKYVFDEEKRIFLGDFDEMYQNEEIENYDSWNQNTLIELDKKISLAIIDQYNFSSILDIGCGKGAFTHLLKRKNNTVMGIDISETAINRAKSKYPDIEFKVLDANKILELNDKFDLVLNMETLSYIRDWKELISDISAMTRYFYLSLFIPDNPIGYIKSIDELSEIVENHFNITHKLVDETAKRIFCFCESKN